VPLPAVVSVKEGLNLPRYPSVPGRLRAKRKEVERFTPTWSQTGPRKLGLRLPEEQGAPVEILGSGPEAASAVVDMLERIGVLAK
jgi:electron transfer flavoprotein beta subunit